MITFWVHEAGRFGIDAYLALRGKPIADRFEVRTYESLAPQLKVSSGAHIFAGIDQLGPRGRGAASALHDELATKCRAARLLNDPSRTLLRFDLLKKLADEGVNSYRVYRASQLGRIGRFPVFVRDASDHSGARTGLLRGASQLRPALAALVARGHRWRDLIVVEFCDTKGADGLFRKYAAFRVGDHIVGSQVMAGSDWLVKSSTTERTLAVQRENLAYVDANPHERWLRHVFDVAQIEYGRIDYGVLPDGQPQVWEINLNPTIGRPPGFKRQGITPDVEKVSELAWRQCHERLQDAFRAIDAGNPQGTVELVLDAATLARATRERARAHRRRAIIDLLRATPQRSILGMPLRWMSKALPVKRRHG